jgi:hypothetical protein
VSSVASAPEGAAPGAGPAPSRPTASASRYLDAGLALVLATGLVVLGFITTGGLDVVAAGGDTWSEVVISVLGGSAVAAAVVLGARGRLWGGVTVGLFAALALLTALSVLWSVAPDDSWQSAAQCFAYLAAFAAAVALARIAPRRWPVLIGAVTIAAVALAGYALLAKALPATLDPGDQVGRLQVPFGYWNAIGVIAALGLPGCLWAGTELRGARILRIAAPLAIAVLISAILLSYSRSALLVAVLGAGAWVAFVPLRLRAAALLAMGSAGAAVIAAWALSTPALTGDRAGSQTWSPTLGEARRVSAGHGFTIVLLATALVLLSAGLVYAVGLERVRLSSSARRRIGVALVALVVLLPVLGIGALAESSRGLTGEVSHVWSSLTSSGAQANVVGDNAERLLQFGNSRPVYWRAGMDVGDHFPLAGAGAEGFAVAHTAYANVTIPVSHVHSYPVETYADLGLIGVAISLALLIAWAIAAARPLALRTTWSSLSRDQARERRGLITLAIVVVAFGIQSAVDWTWYFTGVALPAIVAAGWLAGRGPLNVPVGRAIGRRPLLQRPAAGAALTALAAVTLIGAWGIWQPLRSADAYSASLDAISAGHFGQAFADARDALKIDPVTIQPLPVLSQLYLGAGDPGTARAELVQATQRQPQNPDAWSMLGQFDLSRHNPRGAYASLRRELQLDRTNVSVAATVTTLGRQLGLPVPKP